MRRELPIPPTLTSLARVLPRYGTFSFDRTLEAARIAIGSRPDLANPDHAKRLRVWLNQWLCRIGYPATEEDDVFADSLAEWWGDFKDKLPPEGKGLAQLTDAELQGVSCAYSDLYMRAAAISRTGRIRTVGPTAAAKLLYFVRPCAVTAWDRAISERTGGGQSRAYLAHLTLCRDWARNLEAEGRERGLKPSQIGPSIGRPTSSVAKLIDEWLYATITGGLETSGPDTKP